MNKSLLVIIPDKLSSLVNKGEITDRYYNPGNYFDEVHILLLNDDQPNQRALQKMVGRAKLSLHHLPRPNKYLTLGWQPVFISSWVKKGIALAEKIHPDIVRAHDNFHGGYLAAEICRRLRVPFVLSMHIHPDTDLRQATSWQTNWQNRLAFEMYRGIERHSLRTADRVIIVYEPQRDYVLRNGARDVRLIYNVINPSNIIIKTDYTLHTPPRILSVGRQFKEKNPEFIIRAMVALEASLTLIGDGDYHDYLQSLVINLGLEKKVDLIKNLPNDELCHRLPEYDLFAVHCDYWGIPKAVIEPLLTGLPVIVNRRKPEPTPELNGDWVLPVENNTIAYYEALSALIQDNQKRELLGKRGLTYAREHFLPEKTENQVVELYRELLQGV